MRLCALCYQPLGKSSATYGSFLVHPECAEENKRITTQSALDWARAVVKARRMKG